MEIGLEEYLELLLSLIVGVFILNFIFNYLFDANVSYSLQNIINFFLKGVTSNGGLL